MVGLGIHKPSQVGTECIASGRLMRPVPHLSLPVNNLIRVLRHRLSFHQTLSLPRFQLRTTSFYSAQAPGSANHPSATLWPCASLALLHRACNAITLALPGLSIPQAGRDVQVLHGLRAAQLWRPAGARFLPAMLLPYQRGFSRTQILYRLDYQKDTAAKTTVQSLRFHFAPPAAAWCAQAQHISGPDLDLCLAREFLFLPRMGEHVSTSGARASTAQAIGSCSPPL